MDQFVVPIPLPNKIDGAGDSSFQLNDDGTVLFWRSAELSEGNYIELDRACLDNLVVIAHEHSGLEGIEAAQEMLQIPNGVSRESLEIYVNHFLERQPIVLSLEAGTIYREIKTKAEAQPDLDLDDDSPRDLLSTEGSSLSLKASQFDGLEIDDLRKLIDALHYVKEELLARQCMAGAAMIVESVSYIREQIQAKKKNK